MRCGGRGLLCWLLRTLVGSHNAVQCSPMGAPCVQVVPVPEKNSFPFFTPQLTGLRASQQALTRLIWCYVRARPRVNTN